MKAIDLLNKLVSEKSIIVSETKTREIVELARRFKVYVHGGALLDGADGLQRVLYID